MLAYMQMLVNITKEWLVDGAVRFEIIPISGRYLPANSLHAIK